MLSGGFWLRAVGCFLSLGFLRVFWWLWGFQGSRQNFGASGILPKTTLVVPADSGRVKGFHNTTKGLVFGLSGFRAVGFWIRVGGVIEPQRLQPLFTLKDYGFRDLGFKV